MDFPITLYIYGDTPVTFSYLRIFQVRNGIAYCGIIKLNEPGPWYRLRGYEEFTLNLIKDGKLPDEIKSEELPFSEGAIIRISSTRNIPTVSIEELDSLFETFAEKKEKQLVLS